MQRLFIQLSGSLLLVVCSHLHAETTAVRYENMQEAREKIEQTNDEIDILLAQVKHASTEDEKKVLICETIPKQYELLKNTIELNKDYMTEAEQADLPEIQQLVAEHMDKLLSNKRC
jgi:predicted GTPase